MRPEKEEEGEKLEIEFADVMTLVMMRGEQNLPIRLASAKSKLTVLLVQIRTELSD